MKKPFLVLVLNIIFVAGFSQTTINETQKLATCCKVWGFLKYYHPGVANGKIDWDKALIEKLPLIESAKSKTDLNKVYSDWIISLGKVKKTKHKVDSTAVFIKNFDLTWLNDSSIFDKELILKLNYIKENRSKHHYYFKGGFSSQPFKHEKIYKDSLFPSEGLRLVALFRYWNVINYYYPYKYVIDQDWNKVLEEMIPLFKNAEDTVQYNVAMLLLTTRINDSHAFFNSKYLSNFLGSYFPPFKCIIVDNKVIVSGFWNDTLANKNDILYGDVITKLNNRDISDVIKERIKYVGASNEPTKLQRLSPILFKSVVDSCLITYERNGIINHKTIKLYRFKNFHYKWNQKKEVVCKELPDSIGYINMGVLKHKQVDSVMKLMMTKKAIIFDIRNYPNGTMYAISRYLNRNVKPFAKFTEANAKYPGMFKWSATYYCGKKRALLSWITTYKAPKKINYDYYKGKVVLLFNEETQSHAEFTCMAFQTAPDVKCIGSQTAGADGNVCLFTFPGGYQTYFTGLGVFYPDGRETQRIGIIPDINVKPTIEGVKNKKDEVLDRAIEYINARK